MLNKSGCFWELVFLGDRKGYYALNLGPSQTSKGTWVFLEGYSGPQSILFKKQIETVLKFTNILHFFPPVSREYDDSCVA